MEEQNIIQRFRLPTRLDKASYGTLYLFVDPDDELAPHQFFLQTSHNKEIPEWLSFGYILTEVYRPLMENKEFITTILDHFNKIDDGIPNASGFLSRAEKYMDDHFNQ